MKSILIFATLILTMLNLEAKNPIVSPTFDDIIKITIGEDEYTFDDKNIQVKVPSFADNPVQVPIFVDASKIKNPKKMILFADLNPIPVILTMTPNDFLPIISTNIKVAQETPLRALVLDENNLWHVGSANIHSNGGGCDVTSLAAANGNVSENIGKSKGKIFDKKDQKRVKFSIFHPMETGLVFGASSFFINKIEIKDENDKLLTTLDTSAAISENPRITLETKKEFKELNINFLDTDANHFELNIK
ncbi:quinoprotein dehydrogenase-associated SoxYZ-like carrier [Arcobacter arenosus]|uniref:Quinoprotein dehydrogenase-associated SoxYZ-like carrier n=1 Tax=Arcobacter arenosus TaxID=2576037 RepID=A0A5R8Y0P3_9BACT|nr:quinoprotein dehydrogenase-associated SoxYZ-like carrier [Arcobacter arenosus]TLP38328.1 quinoprotein dehydrogenase-associated SoxYZ-like carrier [Arcobacter arenosus]